MSAEQHRDCSERQDELVEGIARHFGPQATLVRVVARHVLEDHTGLRGAAEGCDVAVPVDGSTS
jgi:hypothetical protein